MLIRSFPAGAFGTNCYAVASGPGQECVVVDPGMDAVEPLARMLAEDGLKPVAVVLTHGHLDHTFSVLPVCDGYDIPAYLHPDDFGMLSDPGRWHGPAAGPADHRRAAARPLRGPAAGRRRRPVAGRGGPHRAPRARATRRDR